MAQAPEVGREHGVGRVAERVAEKQRWSRDDGRSGGAADGARGGDVVARIALQQRHVGHVWRAAGVDDLARAWLQPRIDCRHRGPDQRQRADVVPMRVHREVDRVVVGRLGRQQRLAQRHDPARTRPLALQSGPQSRRAATAAREVRHVALHELGVDRRFIGRDDQHRAAAAVADQLQELQPAVQRRRDRRVRAANVVDRALEEHPAVDPGGDRVDVRRQHRPALSPGVSWAGWPLNGSA